MGVHNLWQLLLPVGRRISVETLERKTLAIDVSIWLTQFIKAMRDDEGKTIKNAHLIGTLRRIIKLLFHKIRPVFVFDGGTPALKRRTVAERKRRRDNQEVSLRKTAQRLLLAQLKKKHLLTAQNKVKGKGRKGKNKGQKEDGEEGSEGMASGFDPGTQSSSSAKKKAAAVAAAAGAAASSQGSPKEALAEGREIVAVGDEEEEDFDWEEAPSTRPSFLQGPLPMEEDQQGEEEDDDGEMVIPEDGEVDPEALANLPPEMQKDVIESAKRKQRLESRQSYIPVAGNPALYSQAQIANFLKSSALNKKIWSLKDYTDKQKGMGGERIASQGNRKFIMLHTNSHDNGGDDEEEEEDTVVNRRVLMNRLKEGTMVLNTKTSSNGDSKPSRRRRLIKRGGDDGSDSDEGKEQGSLGAKPSGSPEGLTDSAVKRRRRIALDEEDEEDGGGRAQPDKWRDADIKESEREQENEDEWEEPDTGGGGFVLDDGGGFVPDDGGGGFIPEGDEEEQGAMPVQGGGFEVEEEDLESDSKPDADGGYFETKRSWKGVVPSKQATPPPPPPSRPKDDSDGSPSGVPTSAPAKTSAPSSEVSNKQSPCPPSISSRRKQEQEDRDMAMALEMSASDTTPTRNGNSTEPSNCPSEPSPPPAPAPSPVISLPTHLQEEEDRQLAMALDLSAAEADNKKASKDVVVVDDEEEDEDDVVWEEAASEEGKAASSLKAVDSGRSGNRSASQDDKTLELDLGAQLGTEGKGKMDDFLSAMTLALGGGSLADEEEGQSLKPAAVKMQSSPTGDTLGFGALFRQEAGLKNDDEVEEVPGPQGRLVISSEQALANALGTASQLTTWAGLAMRRAIRQHQETNVAAPGPPPLPLPPVYHHSPSASSAASSAPSSHEKTSSSFFPISRGPNGGASTSNAKPSTIGHESKTSIASDVIVEAVIEASTANKTDPPKASALSIELNKQDKVMEEEEVVSVGGSSVPDSQSSQSEVQVIKEPVHAPPAIDMGSAPSAAAASSPAVALSQAIDEIEVHDGDDDMVVTWEGATFNLAPRGGDDDDDDLEDEATLRERLKKEMRDAEAVTAEMKEEIMELLQLFGVPYIVSPMEAEAQCAALEVLGLVDGVVSDDSDSFLFGAQTVYKNIFDEKKYVEAYLATDVERELGLSRVDLVALALLLGSDYTEGVRGVGIVNATEIVQAFRPGPGASPEKGLMKFKEWLDGFDPVKDAKSSSVDEEGLDVVEHFHRRHKNARNRWVVDDRFPDPIIFKAYLQPQVNTSTERFEWSLPDLDGIRVFAGKKLGWPVEETDKVVLPAIQRVQAMDTQTRIDSYFLSYHDNTRFARIKSQRLRQAVADLTGQTLEQDNNNTTGAVTEGGGGGRASAGGEASSRGGRRAARPAKKAKRRFVTKADTSSEEEEEEQEDSEEEGAAPLKRVRKRKATSNRGAGGGGRGKAQKKKAKGSGTGGGGGRGAGRARATKKRRQPQEEEEEEQEGAMDPQKGGEQA